jgi:hypothetical protein
MLVFAGLASTKWEGLVILLQRAERTADASDACRELQTKAFEEWPK